MRTTIRELKKVIREAKPRKALVPYDEWKDGFDVVLGEYNVDFDDLIGMYDSETGWDMLMKMYAKGLSPKRAFNEFLEGPGRWE
jgi:hypothetical protein